MSRRIPIRLNKEPLLEAVWEIRFDAKSGLPVGEMLPGMLYQALRESYPAMVRLPAADIPRPIARTDEVLRYVPTVRLEGPPGVPFAIQVGDRVVSLNNRRPYGGWAEFSKRIHELAELLRSTGLIQKPERFSLKYIDLIELDPRPSLASLVVSFSAAGRDLGNQPVQVRTEIKDDPFIHILQVASPVDVVIAGTERRQGTLVDIDTIHDVATNVDFWSALDQRLGEAHDRSKRLFFELLTPEAEQRLEPIYE
jgi:uncharacterized protein (TIGR04255 family)